MFRITRVQNVHQQFQINCLAVTWGALKGDELKLMATHPMVAEGCLQSRFFLAVTEINSQHMAISSSHCYKHSVE